MHGNRLQNGQKVFKGYPGIAIGQRIVSIVISPAFQRETNVLTNNVYLASSEITVRIHCSILGYSIEIMRLRYEN